MKNFKKISLLSVLCALGLVSINAMEDINKAYKGIDWSISLSDPRFKEENKKLLLSMINDFIAKNNQLSQDMNQVNIVANANRDSIKKRLNDIIGWVKLFDLVILDKIPGTEFTPLQLVQFHADKYKKEAWDKLTYAQKAKWAGLFYWDEVTVFWDKLIKAIQDTEKEA